jgi:hypothetical protein
MRPLIHRPVIIVSAPRAGSTLLFETLSQSPDLWTVGGESHGVIEGMPQLHPAAHGWQSNALRARDADAAVVRELQRRFEAQLRDNVGRRPHGSRRGLRLLEKTPRNALRVPFISRVFPDATFVYIYRDAAQTIASMIEGWLSRAYITYGILPGWRGPPWSFLLTPGWPSLGGRSVAEIAALQWATTTRILLDDFAALPPQRRIISHYSQLVTDPEPEMMRLAGLLGITWRQEFTCDLPFSVSTLSPPRRGKWMSRRADVERVLPLVAAQARRAEAISGVRNPCEMAGVPM